LARDATLERREITGEVKIWVGASTTLAFEGSMAEAEYRGQTEFNMPVKESVKSVNNNQLLRVYDTEDSFTRPGETPSVERNAHRTLFV